MLDQNQPDNQNSLEQVGQPGGGESPIQPPSQNESSTGEDSSQEPAVAVQADSPMQEGTDDFSSYPTLSPDTEGSFSEATQLPPEELVSSDEETYSPEAVPPEPSVPPPPTVVVPADGSGVPKWFYLIFGITLIVFFAVTALLINSLLQKSTSSPAPAGSSTSTPAIPSVLPSNTSSSQREFLPTLTPVSEATDQAVFRLRQRSSSDELVDLQSDIDNTDLSSIKESLDVLDREMGITSK